MNMKTFARFRVTIVAAVSLLVAGESPTLCAATYTWDANAGTTGPQDGAGTWNTTLQNWWDGAQNIAWPDPNTADIARFGAGSGAAGTVTVEAVQANGLTFGSAGSGNYTLSSGTITLGGSSPTITTSVNATIQSSLAGSGFTKSGAGTLTLSGALANTFTGTTTVTAGALQLQKSASTRALGGDLVIDGGVVRFQATNQLATTASIQVNGGSIADVGNGGGQSLASVTHASTGTSNLSNWTLSGTLAVSAGTAEVNSGATSTFNTVNVSGGGLLLWAGSGDTTVNVGGGGLTLTGGTIRLGNSNTARIAKLSLGGDVTSNGGGVFQAGNATTRPQIELTGVQRTFTISGGTTTIGAGIAVTGSGGLTKAGAGLLVFSGSNTFSGDTLLNSGTLQIGNSLALQNSPLDTSGAGVVALSGPTTLTLGGLKGSTALASEIASGYSGMTSLTLNVASGTSVTYTGAIADGAAGMSLTKLGSGTQVLSGSNSYTGGTQLNAGMISFGDAAALGTGSVTLGGGVLQSAVSGTLANPVSITAASGTFDSQGNANTVSGTVSGAGSLVKLGSGTLTLSGSNSYSGGTQINAGVLALSNSGALGSTGTISFGGGTLQFSSANTTDYSSRFSTAANQAFRLDTNGQNVALAAALSGSGSSLTKLGSGTLTLSASNSYTGGTQLNAGTLVFGNVNALGTGTATLAGGVLQSGTAGTLSNALNITATSGTFDSQGNANTLSGTVSGVGSLVKLGSGAITLSTSNSYTGGTQLNAGTLVFANANALGTGTATLAGGVLQSGTAGTLTNAFTITATSGTFDSQTNANTLSGTVSGAGSLVKLGSGTLTLSAANSYSGGTQINAGILALGNAGALGSTGTISFGGGTLRFSASNTTDYSSRFSTTDGQAYALDTNGQNVTLATALTSSGGSLTKSGAGTLTLSGAANTYSGTTTLNAGVLSLSKSANVVAVPGDLVVNGGNVVLGAVGQFASTSNLFVNNAGTVNAAENSNGQTVANVTYSSTAMIGLSGWTVTGTLAVASGQITFNTNQSGSFGAITMTGGSLMPYANGSPTTINVGSGGLSMTNALIQYGTSAYNGAGTGKVVLGGDFTGGGTNRLYKGNTAQIAQLDLGTATRTFTITDGTTTIDTGVSVIGSGGLTKAGAGTLALSASNSYSGGTQINAGVVALGNAGALGSTGTISFGGGTLQFSASNTTDYSSRFSTAAGQAYGLDTNGQNITLAGALTSPGGSLTKSGAGRLTLNGANTFSGNTVISGGTLALGSAASLASTFIKAGNAAGDGGVLDVTALGSGLSVAGGQKLGGYGTVLGNVAIAGGAIVAPGGSIGALTESGTMTWGGGGRYLFEITNANGDGSYAGSRWDLLTVTNLLITATSSNPFIVDVQSLTNAGDGAAGLLSAGNWDPDTSYQWKFLVATNTTFSDANFSTNWFTVNSGSFLNATSGLFSVARGGAGGLGGSTTSNELYVVYAAVPEPAALSLAGIGAGLAGWLLWKRRHRRGSR